MEQRGDQLFADGQVVFHRDVVEGGSAIRVDLAVSEVEREWIDRRRRTLRQRALPGFVLSEAVEEHDGRRGPLRWPAPGRSLWGLIQPDRGADWLRSEAVLHALIDALSHLHAQGLGYGYLVPHLVHVVESGDQTTVALPAPELGPLAVSRRDQLGSAHHRYLPPHRQAISRFTEQQEADESTLQRADLFALGRIMLDLFAGSQVANQVDHQLRAEHPDHKQWEGLVKRHVPRPWRNIVLALLVEDRTATILWVRREFALQQNQWWQRVAGALGAIALLALFGVSAVYLFHPAQVTVDRQIGTIEILKSDKERLSDQISDLWGENARLHACCNKSPSDLDPCSNQVQAHVNDTWRQWTRRREGSVADLQGERRSKRTDWIHVTDEATAAVISETLRKRLKDIEAVGRWRVALDDISGIEAGWDYAKITLTITGRNVWDQRVIRRENGTWSFEDGRVRAIPWRPDEPIDVRLEVPGGIKSGYWDHKYIDKTAAGPLAIWRLGRVEAMPWQLKCGVDSSAPPVPNDASLAVGENAAGGDVRMRLHISPANDVFQDLVSEVVPEEEEGGPE